MIERNCRMPAHKRAKDLPKPEQRLLQKATQTSQRPTKGNPNKSSQTSLTIRGKPNNEQRLTNNDASSNLIARCILNRHLSHHPRAGQRNQRKQETRKRQDHQHPTAHASQAAARHSADSIAYQGSCCDKHIFSSAMQLLHKHRCAPRFT
jgi:hypothetical protein